MSLQTVIQQPPNHQTTMLQENQIKIDDETILYCPYDYEEQIWRILEDNDSKKNKQQPPIFIRKMLEHSWIKSYPSNLQEIITPDTLLRISREPPFCNFMLERDNVIEIVTTVIDRLSSSIPNSPYQFFNYHFDGTSLLYVECLTVERLQSQSFNLSMLFERICIASLEVAIPSDSKSTYDLYQRRCLLYEQIPTALQLLKKLF